MSEIIQAISAGQKEQVRRATRVCCQQAGKLYELNLKPITLLFDLRGRAAGMYRVQRGERAIRYNPYLFAKYFDDNLHTTVPHEVAHYIIDLLYGLGNVPAHGAEWRTVMRSLGGDPRATARYDLAGIPVRRQRRFAYRCDCSDHQVSSVRHNRMRRGKAAYHCRRCGMEISYSGD